MSNDAVPQRLRQLRESLAGIYAMKQETATSDDDIRNALTTCALQITSFKRLSRKVYQQKNDHLQEVQVAKKRVEETSLRLQNLQYEKNQLLNEIRRCRDFRTKETDNVDLMPLTNYYKEKGIKQPKTNSKKKDADADHKMHLERLAHELTVRKRLAEELDSLQEQTKQVDSKTSFKIKFLSELTSKLKSVENATRPLQDFFGDQVTQLNESHETATHLPEPLYVLYRQLDSFAQTFGQKNNSASNGNSNTKNKSATKSNASSSSSTSSSSSSSASSSSSSSSSSASSSASSSFVNAYNHMERGISVQLNIVAAVPFPNGGVVEEIPVSFLGKRERIPSVYKEAVLVTLSTTDDGGSMTMRFQYVPSVSKVTCVLVESSDDVPYNMLNELYCSDVANNVLEDCDTALSASPSSLTPEEQDLGVSYLWTQWLAGLYRLSTGSGSTGRRVRPSTSSLLHTLMTRRLRSSLLLSQIKHLEQLTNPVVVPPCVGAVCYPTHRAPQARLTAFSVVPKERTTDDENLNDDAIPSCLALHATFERKFIFCLALYYCTTAPLLFQTTSLKLTSIVILCILYILCAFSQWRCRQSCRVPLCFLSCSTTNFSFNNVWCCKTKIKK